MIKGQVLHFETGKPIKGALIWYGYETNQYVTTDENGFFELNVSPLTNLEIVATGKKPIKDILASQVNNQAILLENETDDCNTTGTLEDGSCITVYKKKSCGIWCWILGITALTVAINQLSKKKQPKEVEL